MSQFICPKCFIDCEDKQTMIEHLDKKHLKKKSKKIQLELTEDQHRVLLNLVAEATQDTEDIEHSFNARLYQKLAKAKTSAT